MSILTRLFNKPDPKLVMQPLYDEIVAVGRQPHWYREGAVPDTLDGRFDMIAAVLTLVLLRLEDEREARQPSVWLTELFVDDMDGQLRQIGIGDLIVGKHIGKMMAALGGRLTAYRAALDDGDFEEALTRNLYRGEAPGELPLAHTAAGLQALATGLKSLPTDSILEGRIHP